MDNTSLTCVQIDPGFTPPSGFDSGWNIPSSASYTSNNCAALATTEVGKDNLVILNPVKENLVISGSMKMKRIEIYSVTGQLAKVLTGTDRNVAGLAKGMYIVRAYSDADMFTAKMIKE